MAPSLVPAGSTPGEAAASSFSGNASVCCVEAGGGVVCCAGDGRVAASFCRVEAGVSSNDSSSLFPGETKFFLGGEYSLSWHLYNESMIPV